MFQGYLIQLLDLRAFNTSSVIDMSSMFADCTQLKRILVGSNWNTDKVISSTSMFIRCKELKGQFGTTYTSSHTDKTYAKVDRGTANPGYLSYRRNLSQETISLEKESLLYTGEAIEPLVIIDGLTIDDDYIVSYSDNVEVGTATVTVTGTGIFYGEVTKTFIITTKDIANESIHLDKDEYIYSGSAIIPAVIIDGLEEGIDFSVEYSNNLNVGTARIEITGQGEYAGTVIRSFEIITHVISSEEIILPKANYGYTGSEINPAIEIEGLTEGTDYTVVVTNNIEIGTGTITVTGIDNCSGEATKTFEIKNNIANMEITLSKSSFVYTGEEITPKAIIEGFEEGVDYTLSYSNNINAGKGLVIITGAGNYAGEVEKEFTITAKSIAGKTVIFDDESYSYTGYSIIPKVRIEGLEANTDFTVTCSNNISVGEASIQIKGIGNYKGSISATFSITPYQLTEEEVSLADNYRTYSGFDIENPVTVLRSTDGKKLKENEDYLLSYSNNHNVGIATITIEGINNYTGTIIKTFNIVPRTITSSAVSVDSPVIFTGEELTPEVEISMARLTQGIDYEVTYTNNINVGIGKAIVQGINNCQGTVTKSFTIKAANIGKNTIHFDDAEIVYSGSPQEPGITIAGLSENTDYTVAYDNNINVGTATVIVTGKGNYEGTKSAEFTIKPANISDAEIDLSKVYFSYTGNEIKPSVIVKGLTEGTDFEVSYSDNINSGIGKVTVNGIGNYSGSVSKLFTIFGSSICSGKQRQNAQTLASYIDANGEPDDSGNKFITRFEQSDNGTYYYTRIGEIAANKLEFELASFSSANKFPLTLAAIEYSMTTLEVTDAHCVYAQKQGSLAGAYTTINASTVGPSTAFTFSDFESNILIDQKLLSTLFDLQMSLLLKKAHFLLSDETGLAMSDIGFTKYDPGDNHTHEFKDKTTIAASCDSDGYKVLECALCGEKSFRVLDREHAWDSGTVTKEATCTEEGEIIYTCNSCGKKKHESIELLNHNMTTFPEIEATCTQGGNKLYYYCDQCHRYFKDSAGKTEIKKDSWITEAKGHYWNEIPSRKKPTCTEDGYQYIFCARCYEKKDVQIIPKLGHDYVLETKDSTCTDAGVNKQVCSRCGDTIEDPIPAKGHLMNRFDAVAATCTEPGNTEYWYCSRCEKYFSDEEGEQQFAKNAWIIPAAGHKWNAGQITTVPTATKTGIKTFTCTICNEARTEILPARNNQVATDGTKVGPGASEEVANKAITGMKNDKDPAGSVFGLLKLRSTKQAKTSVTITWTKVKGAKKYVIYGNACGKTNKMKKLATITGSKYTVKKVITNKGKKIKVKKGTYYKFIVVALNGNRDVVSTSKVIHIATPGGKVGNDKTVTTKAKKNKVTIKVGKTFALKAKAVPASKRTVKRHRGIVYESSNKSIATVSAKGVIKGKKKGTCVVYVYAQNGINKKITVIVK